MTTNDPLGDLRRLANPLGYGMQALFTALKKKRGYVPPKAEHLSPDQKLFLTPDEAKEYYDFDVREGFLLKLTGAQEEGVEPIKSIISPEKWEIFPDEDLFISPQGTHYTQQQHTELYEQQQVGESLEVSVPEYYVTPDILHD